MRSIFKLYPWEWMVHEEFADEALRRMGDEQGQTLWIEPIWKMLWSNKGILPVLWRLFPDHPNLLPAYFEGEEHKLTSYVRKPLLAREGANSLIVIDGKEADRGPDQGYGEEGYVIQQFTDLGSYDGNHPVLGHLDRRHGAGRAGHPRVQRARDEQSFAVRAAHHRRLRGSRKVFELVLQVLAYSGVGLVVLVIGFYVLDLLTPGKLGHLVMEGNPGAGLLAATGLASLGLILYFAIHFTGAGWDGLDDAAIFGLVGVLVQAVGFFVLDMVIPGKLGDHCFNPTLHPAAYVGRRHSGVGRAGRLRVADVGQPARLGGALAALHRVHQLDHGVVARRRDAELAALGGDAAVDDVDLGVAPGIEVLQHRGADVVHVLHHLREAVRPELVRLDVVDALERQALRVADRDALGPQRVDGVRPLLADAAVAQPGDRAAAR